MILIFFVFVRALSELVSIIIYSEFTPPSLVSDLSLSLSSSFSSYISMAPFSEDLIASFHSSRVNAVFDFTSSVVFSLQLKSLSSSQGLLYFTNQQDCEGKWNFCLHPSPLTEAKAIQKFLDFLGWDQYFLMTSESQHSKTMFQYLSHDPLFVLSTLNDQESYDLFVGRTVKPTANWKVVALTEPQGASKMLQALKNLRIYTERCGIVLGSRATWGEFETGTIIISEEGLELAKSEGEFEFKAILRALDLLDQAFDPKSISQNRVLRDFLEHNTPNHVISDAFSILNYVPERRVAGNITDIVKVERIVFPGNVTEFNTSPPVITMSANLAFYEQDGTFNLPSYVMNAAIVPMVQIINEDPTLLSNFHLQIYGTYCAASVFDYTYVSDCMRQHLDNLGVFYMENSYDIMKEGHIQIFRENGLKIPHTSIFGLDIDLYDKQKYPELYITNANSLYIYSILPYILNTFRWKQVLVYFQDNVTPSLYNAFMDNMNILEIQVKNKIMEIPLVHNSTFEKTNEKALKEAFESKCRIFVLLFEITDTIRFMESMYDLGLRRGDAVFILNDPLSNTIEHGSLLGFDKEKALELADGSLSLTHNEYIGEYGQQLEHQISKMIDPLTPAFTCFQIDSLLLGVHTIDMMLRIGRNYDDPEDMNYFMRQQLFTGCSGTLSIDSGGNGRNELSFTLHNFYVEGEQWIEKEIGYYYIGITVPLKISRAIWWPNGSTDIPEDMRKDPECGIDESDIEYLQQSILISVIGTAVFFVVVLVACITIWCKNYRIKHNQIETKRALMFEDGIEIAMPFIESSQYIALGPGDSVFNLLTLVLPIDTFLESKYNIFWRVLIGTGTLSLVWSMCIFSAIFLLDRRCHRDIKNISRYIGLTMLPLFSKICFLPFFWMLLRLFECKQGVGSEPSDAFLRDDCNFWCWKGLHLGISIVCVVLLTMYTILATISGTLYDAVMDHVSIKTNPLFSTLKTLFKVVLVLTEFHLREMYGFIFSLFYLSLCLAWTVFVFSIESYNYQRLVMWQKVNAIWVCLHLFLIVIQERIGFQFLVVLLLDLFIILTLGIAGLFIQYNKYPGYFFKRKGRNFAKLLKFAYTSKIDFKELTIHQLDYVKKQIEVIENPE